MSNRPWWHIANRLYRNPFHSVYPIEHLEWCHVCKMDVDTDVETANADGVDVYRKRCKRCGGIIQWGIGRRHITKAEPLPAKAYEFVSRTGRDRR
jgi:hypothetical protein